MRVGPDEHHAVAEPLGHPHTALRGDVAGDASELAQLADRGMGTVFAGVGGEPAQVGEAEGPRDVEMGVALGQLLGPRDLSASAASAHSRAGPVSAASSGTNRSPVASVRMANAPDAGAIDVVGV